MDEGGSDSAGGGAPAASRAGDGLDVPAVLSRLDADDPATRRRAVETVRTAVDDDPEACVPTVSKLRELLERPAAEFHDRLAYCLAELAAASPDDVAPSAAAVAAFAAETDDDEATVQALRCLANLAEARPDAVVDHVDALAGELEANPDPRGVSLLDALSREYPEAVVPFAALEEASRAGGGE